MNRSLPVLLNVFRGFLMGSADVVPGVSGGTVALIVGVYERLVGAISRFDMHFCGNLRRFEIGKALAYIDFPFLASLGTGIALALVTVGSTMESLLIGTASRPITLAVFMGMIVASTILVAGWIDAPKLSAKWWYASLAVAAAAFAFWVTGVEAAAPRVSNGYVFFCGMVGICAMILPGLSGAYLLLVLGLYSHLTDILHRLPHLDVGIQDVMTVAVFGAGCAVGLLLFSKVLKWLLANQRAATMAVLCGFMIGALRKVWPFQSDVSPPGAESLKEKVYESRLPVAGDPVATIVIAALLAMAAVLIIDQIARRFRPITPNVSPDRQST